MELLTGYTGENNIDTEAIKNLMKGYFGELSVVLPYGDRLEPVRDEEDLTVSLKSGLVCFDGVIFENSGADFTVAYTLPGSGYYRRNWIYLAMTRQAVTGTGSYDYTVTPGLAVGESKESAEDALNSRIPTSLAHLHNQRTFYNSSNSTIYMGLWSFVTSANGVVENSLKRMAPVLEAGTDRAESAAGYDRDFQSDAETIRSEIYQLHQNVINAEISGKQVFHFADPGSDFGMWESTIKLIGATVNSYGGYNVTLPCDSDCGGSVIITVHESSINDWSGDHRGNYPAIKFTSGQANGYIDLYYDTSRTMLGNALRCASGSTDKAAESS